VLAAPQIAAALKNSRRFINRPSHEVSCSKLEMTDRTDALLPRPAFLVREYLFGKRFCEA
jgi:hypothetical protein